MKKFLMLFTALLTLTVATYAQKGKGSGQTGFNIEIFVQPGMSMGGNYDVGADAIVSAPPYVDMNKSFTFGMNAGAEAGYNFTDNIGAGIGLLYSHQGQDYKFTYTVTGPATLKGTSSLNYFKMPFLFHFTAPMGNNVSFIGSAGFYVAILMGYKNVMTSTFSGGSDVETAKGSTFTDTYTDTYGSGSDVGTFLFKPYTSSDFGGLLEAGFQFELSKNMYLPLTLNYQIGLSNVKNIASTVTDSGGGTWAYWGDGSDPNLTLAYHNSSLELKIGLKIFF